MISGKFRGWVYVLLLIIPYIIFVGIFEYFGYILAGLDPLVPSDKSLVQHLILQSSSLAGTFSILWIFMRFVDKMPFAKLGLYIKNRVNEFLIGTVLGLLIMVLGYFILVFAGELQYVSSNADFRNIVISIVLFSIVAVVEEVLLRGYVLRNFMICFNKYTALVLSSLLFSLMHGLNPNIDLFAFIDLFLAGILLGSSYLFTRNLWFPIGLHLGWNLFQSFLGFNVSGQDFYSIVTFSTEKANLWNGGAFGFEGSLLSVLFQLIVIAGVFIFYSRQRSQKPVSRYQLLRERINQSA